jgi:hypothetical protein
LLVGTITIQSNVLDLERTNVGADRSQLAPVAKGAKATLKVGNLDAVADRGSAAKKLACEEAGITVILPRTLIPLGSEI